MRLRILIVEDDPRVSQTFARTAVEWARLIAEQARATQKESRQLRDDAGAKSAESEALRERAKKARDERPPTEGPP